MIPEVSIIMPCYNQAAYVAEAMACVQAQTLTNWECILVSDGSPDNAADIANVFCKQDNRFSFYDTENSGPSAARNFGILKAKAEFILPLDADDRISPNYIEECIKTLSAEKKFKVAYGASEKFGLKNEPWPLGQYRWNTLLFTNCIHSCGMYRKTDWAEIGGYDEKMTEGIEDWEFWINLLKNNAEVVKLENITLYWRIKKTSRTTLLQEGSKFERMSRYIYYKHADLYGKFFPDPIQLYTQHNELKKNWDWVNKNSFRFFLSRVKRRLTGKHNQ